MPIRKAIIPLAGRATRQYPASTALPKALFPLVDRDGLAKPLIHLLVEEAVDSGIEQICLVTRPGEEDLYRNYFRPMDDDLAAAFSAKDWARLASHRLSELGQRLHFVEQASPQGLGHAVLQARRFVADEPFLLLLGDHLFISATKDRCARQLLRAFDEQTPDAATAVQIIGQRELHLLGVIRGTPLDEPRGIYHAEQIIEKPSLDTARQHLATPGLPAGNYLAHFGLHAFSPRIFGSIEHLLRTDQRHHGEIQLTAAQEHLRQQGVRYLAILIHGHPYDTGIPSGLLEAQLALSLTTARRAEFLESLTRLLARHDGV